MIEKDKDEEEEEEEEKRHKWLRHRHRFDIVRLSFYQILLPWVVFLSSPADFRNSSCQQVTSVLENSYRAIRHEFIFISFEISHSFYSCNAHFFDNREKNKKINDFLMLENLRLHHLNLIQENPHSKL